MSSPKGEALTDLMETRDRLADVAANIAKELKQTMTELDMLGDLLSEIQEKDT